jgi:methylmalonyl-CoA mutase C-terminal domain/subunit
MQRKIRVLVGKPGLDGHDRGAKVVAAALRDAGMEVIYTGLHQSSEQVVEAAIQEDVDVVALSILSGAHMTLFPEVLELMRSRGVGDKLLTGGGIIPPDDMDALAKLGIGRLFGPGSSTVDIVHYVREWFAAHHGADVLAPLPESFGRAPSAGAFAMSAAEHRAAHAPARSPGGARGARPAKQAAKRAAPKRAAAKPARKQAKRAAPKRAKARPVRAARPAKRTAAKRAPARRAAPKRGRAKSRAR